MKESRLKHKKSSRSFFIRIEFMAAETDGQTDRQTVRQTGRHNFTQACRYLVKGMEKMWILLLLIQNTGQF
jgi:hypothetical protein